MEVPSVDFVFVSQKDCNDKAFGYVNKNSSELFGSGKHVLFALPGAFTPTCTQFQLPSFEATYNNFKLEGVDEVWCISVNDGFVMNAWQRELGIEKVKLIPDGNALFTGLMNQLVTKMPEGFGLRSWRYACIIENGVITKLFEEPGKEDDAKEDPYEVTYPENITNWLRHGEVL